MSDHATFSTERLYLRPTNEEDADFLIELLNTPKYKQNIGERNVRTREDALRYIAAKVHPQFERLGYGNYTVILKEDGVRIGTCGLYDREGIDGIDIGFAFLPAFEGKGYASESARRLRDAALHQFGLQKLGAITLEANVSSRRLLERIGLVFIKKMRIPNDEEELMYYELPPLPS